jgi:hypothetical protein
MDCPQINFPLTTPCGSGICLNKTLCLCEPPWSGRGDLSFGEPHCNVHIDALRFIWILAFCYSTLMGSQCAIVTYAATNSSRKIKNTTKIYPFYYTYRFWMYSTAFLACVCGSILSLLKSIDPGRQIGVEYAVTLLFTFAIFFVMISIYTFLFVFIELSKNNFLLHKKEEHTLLDNLAKSLKKWLPMNFFVSQPAAWGPVFMLFSRSSEDMFYITVIYYVSTLYSNTFCTRIIVLTINPVLDDLLGMIKEDVDLQSASMQISNEKYKRLAHKFKSTKLVLTVMCVLNNVVLIMMTGWAYLHAFSSYYLPMLIISSAVYCTFITLFAAKQKMSCANTLTKCLQNEIKGSLANPQLPSSSNQTRDKTSKNLSGIKIDKSLSGIKIDKSLSGIKLDKSLSIVAETNKRMEEINTNADV